MNETLCGKICETCEWRMQQSCSGCQAGPGGRGGDCKIAGCCREKGHQTCTTCGFQLNCQLLRDRNAVPRQRQAAWEQQAARKTWHEEHAPILGKWLWFLFWLNFPSMAASLLVNERIAGAVLWLRVSGETISFLCILVCAFALWQLRTIETRYRTAAICNLGLLVGNVLLTLLIGDGGQAERLGLVWLVLIPFLAVSLIATYQEYHAHAAVLAGLDDALSEKWRRQWKWEIGLLAGLFGGVILIVISAGLGALALIADLIGLIVLGIRRLVYQYHTAQTFRKYSVGERSALPDETVV